MAHTISELARSAGVGVETVRFYQRRGLIDDPRPSDRGGAPGRRHYGADDVRRLRFIRRAQAAGFTLAQIGELIALDRSDDRARVRQLARERIAALDSEIARLEDARTALSRLSHDCAKGDRGPCPILAAFD